MLDDKSKGFKNGPWTYVLLLFSFFLVLTWSSDGTTILPTFMPVATQAALKGLTPQQVEQLGMNYTIKISIY